MKLMLSYIFVGLVISLIIMFVMFNVIVQCNDWNDPACVTPKDFIEFFGIRL